MSCLFVCRNFCIGSAFTCGDGSVINIALRCNGRYDCPHDRQDETNCR